MSSKPSLLLHSCCAPCSSAVLERLTPSFDVTVFYYNPNIYPQTEYIKRLKEQKEYLKKIDVKIIEGNYDENEYLEAISNKISLPEGSTRCFECYKFRLTQTAKLAQQKKFNYFTTTLSVSPHKNADWINQIGKTLETNACKFLEENFKKQNGFLKTMQLAK